MDKRPLSRATYYTLVFYSFKTKRLITKYVYFFKNTDIIRPNRLLVENDTFLKAVVFL